MADQSPRQTASPSPDMFAATDRFAGGRFDAFVLVTRVLIGWFLFINGWAALMNISAFVAYLDSLKVPAPGFWAWPAMVAELGLGAALIVGVATRYAALTGAIYVLIATALAHRYWEYPQAQQVNQYAHFLKNLAVLGGMLLLFATGAGRFSLDAWLRRTKG
jgi:putative oxidoreductase